MAQPFSPLSEELNLTLHTRNRLSMAGNLLAIHLPANHLSSLPPQPTKSVSIIRGHLLATLQPSEDISVPRLMVTLLCTGEVGRTAVTRRHHLLQNEAAQPRQTAPDFLGARRTAGLGEILLPACGSILPLKFPLAQWSATCGS